MGKLGIYNILMTEIFLYFVLRSRQHSLRKSVYQLLDSTGMTNINPYYYYLLLYLFIKWKWPLAVCPQRSRPLHGLGQDGGPALRLLYIRGMLQWGGAGLPHRRLQGQNWTISSPHLSCYLWTLVRLIVTECHLKRTFFVCCRRWGQTLWSTSVEVWTRQSILARWV